MPAWVSEARAEGKRERAEPRLSYDETAMSEQAEPDAEAATAPPSAAGDISNASAKAVPPRRPGFLTGLRSLFGGFGFVLGTPAVWPLAVVPVLMVVLVGGLLGSLSVAFIPGLMGDWIGPTSSALGAAGRVVLQALATLVALLLALLAGYVLAQPLSGPALEGIARRQGRRLGAPELPPTSFFTDVLRSLEALLLGYALGLPLLAVLFVIALLFPPAAVVTTPLKLVVVAAMIAWDLCDYPLTLRGLTVGQRFRVVIRYRAAVVGFGAGLALASLLPCVLFLLLPVGVAGATRLMWAVERWERTAGTDDLFLSKK